MATSYLLSGLAAYAQAIDLAGFRARYPHHWVVWEVGEWEPPRASTVQMDRETFKKLAAAAESQAMALEERPDVSGQLRQLTLGRGSGCDLVITDGTVSERHLVFTRESTGWNVRDVGSRNGSQVNGQPLSPGQPRALQNGEQLLAGQVRLTYYSVEGMYARARSVRR